MRFFAIFLSLDHQFSLQLRTMIACNNVKPLVEVELANKIFGAKIVPGIRLCAIFSNLVYQCLQITLDDSLEQWLATSRGKIHTQKFLGLKFGPNRPKLCPELGFSLFSQVFQSISFLGNCIGCQLRRMPNYQQMQNPQIKFLGSKCRPNGPNLGPDLGFL